MGETATNTRAGTLTPDGAEQTIDTLIERRAREVGDPDYDARQWRQSLDRYNMAAAVQRREAWAKWHARLAVTHRELAAEHERAITRLHEGV